MRRRPYAVRGLKQLFWAVVAFVVLILVLKYTGIGRGLGK